MVARLILRCAQNDSRDIGSLSYKHLIGHVLSVGEESVSLE